MSRTTIPGALAGLLFLATSAGADFGGVWPGAIQLPGGELRISVTLAPSTDSGAWTGTIDIPAQGLQEFGLSNVSVTGDQVHFEMDGVPGVPSFDGKMEDDQDAITGTFRQGSQSFPFVLGRSEEEPAEGERQAEQVALRRPQEPRPPFPYVARDLTFHNEAAGLVLAGTFVVPEGKGPFPAVLFVTGSGPQDRDEALLGHRPFLVLADHLARRGIASLRFDDRGAGESQGDHMGSTMADFATDVAAGLAFLASQPEARRGALGILGHSEGGLLAATQNEAVDFLVLLAPPGVPIDRLLAHQTRDLLRMRGVDDSITDAIVGHQVGDLELVKDASIDREQLEASLRARAADARNRLDGREGLMAQTLDEATVEQGIAVATTPWFRSLARSDPAAYLRQTSIPVLALFGEKDLQVAARENADALSAALAAADNDDVDVRVLPGLNHLFQRAETGSVEEYGSIEETISPEVLDLVAGWIRERFAD